jgi:hypothetical protein
MPETLTATNAIDAGRSAIAVLHSLRTGDHLAAVQLAATLSDVEKGNLIGALAALANQLLNSMDDVLDYARAHGCGELSQTADDAMRVLAMGFAR